MYSLFSSQAAWPISVWWRSHSTRVSSQYCPIELSAVMEKSLPILSNMAATSHMWLLGTWNKASATEVLNCSFNSIYIKVATFSSVQFSSVAQSCLTLCNPMNRSMPGLPVHHQLLDFTQTHVHRVSDAIQPSCPLSSPSPPAPNPSQHQSLFQCVNSSHEVAKVLEFQL